LEGVGGEAKLNQQDGIHPTAEGARIVAQNVWQVLQPLL
jgi:acyl-CoA thioesterase-1